MSGKSDEECESSSSHGGRGWAVERGRQGSDVEVNRGEQGHLMGSRPQPSPRPGSDPGVSSLKKRKRILKAEEGAGNGQGQERREEQGQGNKFRKIESDSAGDLADRSDTCSPSQSSSSSKAVLDQDQREGSR
ncbi:unnamed protein product, partial [Discosporangium mesarthrocarpum]